MSTFVHLSKLLQLTYCIVFAILMTVFIYATDNRQDKRSRDFFIYLAGFLVFETVFILGAVGISMLLIKARVAILLITSKFSFGNYQKVFTTEIDEDEAALLKKHFTTHDGVEGFYKYEVIDDQSSKSYYSVNSDLLEYVKDTNKKPHDLLCT